LDPFSWDELESDGFGKHLTGRGVLTSELTDRSFEVAKKKDAECDARRKENGYAGSRLTLKEIGEEALDLTAVRFTEANQRMAFAREAAKGSGKKGPEAWSDASRSSFFI
tara:strand:+ start:280 stop:609 length:330 start_codon:yes stop_codon:yes gene_type:complete